MLAVARSVSHGGDCYDASPSAARVCLARLARWSRVERPLARGGCFFLFFLPFLVVGCVISSVVAWVPELELELLVVLLVVLEVV